MSPPWLAPDDICFCVLPQPSTGLNLTNGWGETRCRQCRHHIKWGCADFDPMKAAS